MRCWAATNLGHRETCFGSPRAVIGSPSTPIERMLHSWNQSATGGNTQYEIVQGNLSLEVRTKSKDCSNAEMCKDTINHEFFFLQKECIHRITWLINKDFGSRSFNLTNSLLHKIIFMLEDKIQNPSKCLF